MKNIVAIIGSASANSSNHTLINYIKQQAKQQLNITVYDCLKELPHFDPIFTDENTPIQIINFRELILKADGVLISTPEYIFSIPSGLKNALEWCVSSPTFMHKPLGILTASANGKKGHEELQLIMQTLMAAFTTDTTLLISGAKGKTSMSNEVTDIDTKEALNTFISSFIKLINIDQKQ
ncbi:NADPH-dependent FMN reductase [Empedobacter brevis]|uniref:NADPH-dependent FMN reductase n=1 Tax=Empedobacter brevis TaxID=247 RepID=UPI00289996A8|nr:NADPH-dependent FMN reductase [Empedobacter brevis]